MSTDTKNKANTKQLSDQGRVESAPATPGNGTIPSQSEIVKKITTKIFQKADFGAENGAKIAGVIRGQKQRTGTYGEYTAFIGTFRCIYGGKVYMSTELILPAFPEAILRDGFAQAFSLLPEGSKNNAEATFAFIIWRKDDSANTRNARGFTWEVKQILEAKAPDVATDPLLKLLA